MDSPINYISKALPHRLKSNVRNRDVTNKINNNKENVNWNLFPFTLCRIKKWTISQTLIKFDVIYGTKKISFYCNVKDKVPHE